MSLRALIIDKDEAVAGQLADALLRRGYEVDVCATGREGIDRARGTMPDAIVLCVELEDTSGYSVCAKLKKDVDLKDIPLIITSEKATRETFEHHQKLKTRAQQYVMKPFDSESLAEDLGGMVGGAPAMPPPVPLDEVSLDDVEVLDAVEDAGEELDEALAHLTDAPPPLPPDLDSMAGIGDPYDEDDIRTTIGRIPSDIAAPPPQGPTSGTHDLSQDDLVRRVKEAERARDAALATARSAEAQLRAMNEGASQLPAAASGSRELIAIKKDLNAKEREILELRDSLQEKDRQLLASREREADLEDRVVEAEEAQAAADRARVEAEGRIAGAEARADEVQRSSSATIADLDQQLEAATQYGRDLDQQLESARARIADLESTVEAREATIVERDARIADLEQRLASTEGTLADTERTLADTERTLAETTERLEGELERARENIEGLEARADGLQGELDEARHDNEGLRGRLSTTEDLLARSEETNQGHVDLRAKTRQALEITLNMLIESEDADSADASDEGSDLPSRAEELEASY